MKLLITSNIHLTLVSRNIIGVKISLLDGQKIEKEYLDNSETDTD